MSHYDKLMLIALGVFYFPTFGLLYFMGFKVNRNLPKPRRIPFPLFWNNCTKIVTDYKGFYPTSILHRLFVSGEMTFLIIAVAMLAFRFWEYAKHIP